MAETKKTRFTDIPPDILFHILAKVPAKSLIRCRSVSKLWRDVIDDPRFITTQLSNNVVDESHLVCFCLEGKNLRLIQFNGSDKLTRSNNALRTLPDQVGFYDRDIICEGIFFFKGYRRGSVLFNPLTGESIEVTLMDRDVYGLGFDFKSNVFKFVCIRENITRNNRSVFVFTLGNSKCPWRLIDSDFALPNIYPKSVVGTPGYLHWLTFRGDKESILCFGIEREEFMSILCPKVKSTYIGSAYITSWKQSLAIVYFLSSRKRIEVWVLKDCKSGEWKKAFQTNKVELKKWYDDLGMLAPRPCVPIRIVGEWNDGLLFEIGYHVNYMFYNPNDNSIRFLELVQEGQDFAKVNVFVPTLASLTS
ncbi:hypothetical protein ACFE04_018585 [Oxalis oulophora]